MSSFNRSENEYPMGTVPVWINVDPNGKRLAGGSLSELPLALPVTIPGGTPCYLSGMGNDVELMKVYELKDAIVSASSTTVTFNAPADWQPLVEGQILMKAPATIGTTGTAYAVTAVTTDAETGEQSFTIATGAWGTAAAGDLFVVSASATAGASKTVKVPVNGLTWHDMRIEEDAFQQTTPVVFNGTILVDRIAPIPAMVKVALPMINFNAE